MIYQRYTNVKLRWLIINQLIVNSSTVAFYSPNQPGVGSGSDHLLVISSGSPNHLPTCTKVNTLHYVTVPLLRNSEGHQKKTVISSYLLDFFVVIYFSMSVWIGLYYFILVWLKPDLGSWQLDQKIWSSLIFLRSL